VDIVVVDDGSSTGDGEVADEISARTPITVVHRRMPGGPAVARNEGLRRAKGDFVVFLDGDDALRPGSLARLRARFDEGVVAVLGRFEAVDSNGRPIDIGTWANEQLRPVVRRDGGFVESVDGFSDEAMLTRLVTPPPGAVMVRRDAALAVGGYDVTSRRSEDVEFLVRLSEIGQLVAIDDVVLAYRRRAAQRSSSIRRRQLGRQRTLAHVIWRAPSSARALARARGAAAHHVDRAMTRWKYSSHGPDDVFFVLRSLSLAGVFWILGRLAASAQTLRRGR